MKRRTFLAAAIAAMYRPALSPPAPTVGVDLAAPGAVDITCTISEYLGAAHGLPQFPGYFGRLDGFRFIESPMPAPSAAAQGLAARIVASLRRTRQPVPDPLAQFQRIHLNAEGWLETVVVHPDDLYEQLKGKP